MLSFRVRAARDVGATLFVYLSAAALLVALAGCGADRWPPGVQDVPADAPVLTPEQALETFFLPPGYDIELVAAEPMIEDPVAIDFDADGRLWVVEMRSYMPNVYAENEGAPRGRVSVLEDVDGDGRMDRSTVFLDSLVLPRAVKALDSGILVAEPPFLWLARDTTGDLRADVKEALREDYGVRENNPERNPNGLVWSLDNALLSVWYDKQLRLEPDRSLSAVPTLDNAQWGVSFDDYGFVFKNSNADPLRVDLLPGTYYARHPYLERTAGAYVDIVEDESVWPVRPTPGINRGYRDHMLREDSTLATFTAAGSPVVFRGDRLPKELVGDVFVTEPAGNLVRRFIVERRSDGGMAARNAYEQAEFLASTDERFRPVNLYSAPDGTLYVVDFYRGIIQHRDYLTEYLQDYILARDLDEPLGLGRIYRITHEDHEPGPPPQLSTASSLELVELLSHPNGWWRDAAQRLLVERRETSVESLLRELAVTSDDQRTRLHALWTLDGLGAAPPTAAAMRDPSPYVRAAAVRLQEGSLDMLELSADSSVYVRRQLAASVGTLPAELALEAAADLVAAYGNDPVVVDAALSGLGGHEMQFLSALMDRADDARTTDAIAMAAAAASHRGRVDAVIARIDAPGLDARRRIAIIDGLMAFAPDPPRDDEEWVDYEPHLLGRRPEALLSAAEDGDDQVSAAAAAALERFTWPGKPAPERPDLPPLTDEQQARFDRGRELFGAVCATCHGEDGQGRAGEGVSLVGSRWLNGDEDPAVRIVLHGKEGTDLMPPMRNLTDDQIAAVLTFVRRSWRNRGSAVSPEEVEEVRGRTASRRQPWTEEELAD